MKILFVATLSNTVNSFLVPHIKLLIRKGHNVDVAFNKKRQPSQELLDLGCRIFEVEFQRSPLKKKNIHAYKRIKKIITNEKYDLVHTHTPIASLITRYACKNIGGLKVLYTAHGFHFLKGSSIKNWLIYYPMEKIAAKWTDGLITINNEDYFRANNSIRLRKPNSSSVFKTNGIGLNLSKFSPTSAEKKINLRRKYKYSESDFILVYVAELNSNKHQDLLLDSLSLLKNKIPNLKLLLVGEGKLESLYKERVNNLGLSSNVDFLGFRTDIPDLLKLADVGVASSKREGLPVNVMEVMATGLPLVVTNTRGHNDLVVNEENGYLINGNDTNGFASAVYKLYSNEDLRRKLGEKSIKKVEEYSEENVLEQLDGIYSLYI
ncbi:glycosyltransferase family 4 protein [Pontibacillus salipaludis]|uniref:Glycosyltransferase EpsD n=1 Tax=Pontibacillus salipaludis TaxID=1697394 RepID=A0ABQ1QI76_9BACI|nr:glycosyltransferase family 4 protein [Pontibacillus salipaludis]GGD28599.1 putative glycosyltransferase EpsD [Pontibacillus salipaludis]